MTTYHTSVWVGKDGKRKPFVFLPEFYQMSDDIPDLRQKLLDCFVPYGEMEVLFITREVEL